jgi:ditrans,polycis-polyprenyl diphosphate synthase
MLRRLILESPPGEWALNRLRELLIGALRQGPVPQHVAFEMDGNRRYARSHRMETVEGHHRGFEALARVGHAETQKSQTRWDIALTMLSCP